MSTQTWQKACDCKGATATAGRYTFNTVDRGRFVHFYGDLHTEPVCDSCDTPWKPVESEERSGELDEMETRDQWMRP